MLEPDPAGFDNFLCGDDAITQAVIDKSLPRLKIISKYGIGVDKIDVKYATAQEDHRPLHPRGEPHHGRRAHLPPLLLALEQNFLYGVDASRKGEWKPG